MAVIEVNRLRKAYRDKVAVDDVSFSVEDGEIFGILGPNGAGKTTTVECIEGLRHRDGGDVSVLGLDPQHAHRALTQIVGVQLQESALQDKLRVGEAMKLFASFYPDPADPAELLHELGIADAIEHPVSQAVRRPEAAAVHRAGAARPAADRGARRADHRPGPRRRAGRPGR